jgi:hypothetical protein
MMMEKRRGMAARAKANGSLVRRFRSPIALTPPFDLSVPSLSIKYSSCPFNLLRSRDFLYVINSTIYGYINKEDEIGIDEVNE